MILEGLAYLASALVLIAYAYLIKTNNPRPLNTANFFCAFPLVILAIVNKSYPHAILSAFFGITGAWGIWKAWGEEAKEGVF